MKPLYYVAIFLRMFSVWLVLYGFSKFPKVLLSSTESTGIYIVTLWFPVLVPFILATILWLFPLKIAGLFVKAEYNSDSSPIDSKSAIAILLIAIGLFRLSYVLPDLLYWVAIQHEASIHGTVEYTPQDRAGFISSILEFSICLLFVIRAGAIANFLLRFAK